MKDYIEYQSNYINTYLGKYPVSYNGWGAIALHNLCVFFGRQLSIHEENLTYIIDYFSPKMWFKGAFGILPWQLSKFLKLHDFKKKVRIIKLNHLQDYLDDNQGNVFIIMYAESETLHYIFVDDMFGTHTTSWSIRDIVEKSSMKYCIVYNILWLS